MHNPGNIKKNEKNLSEGQVFKTLLLFALPFLISNIVQSLYNVADMLIVGNFSDPAPEIRAMSMSGVNIGGQVTFILTNIVIGLCIGATVLIGQYMGSGDEKALKKVVSTIITLLVAISMVITPLMLILKVPLLRLIQTPDNSFDESSSYLTVTVIGIIFIFGYNALAAILRGMGNTKQPLYFVTAACVTNIILDLIFVGVFNMKAFGAALATVVSQAMSVFLCILYMVRSKFTFDFKLSSFKIHRDQLALIIKTGLPTCVQNGIVGFSFLFLTAIVNIIGQDIASAAVGAVGKFNSIVFMPIMAISMSVSVMSAQNIGAGKLDRAAHTCKIGILMAFFVGGVSFVFIRMFPAEIMRMFGDNKDVIDAGVLYLRTFSFDFLLIPFIFCLNGLYIGGGHTVFTLINTVLSSILLRVPATYLFGSVLGLGLSGAGAAVPIASVGALILGLWFLISGRWKVNAVKHHAPVAEM